jgi:type III restriction enzyme
MVVSQQPDMRPKKSIFNRVVGDRSELELDFATFLDSCEDVVSFVKNTRETNFSVEYRTADGSIANYFPDFVVKRSAAEIWIVETKGREDVNDEPKIDRLKLWCADASAADPATYRAMYVLEEEWEALRLRRFDEAVAIFGI